MGVTHSSSDYKWSGKLKSHSCSVTNAVSQTSHQYDVRITCIETLCSHSDEHAAEVAIFDCFVSSHHLSGSGGSTPHMTPAFN